MFKNKVLLITGGTGSFGNAVLKRFLDTDIKEIRIFSRDEKKQDDMRHALQNPKVKFYIGDVRDKRSVDGALRGVDYIFHAAALKQVPSCEFFPIQAVRTNVFGTENVLDSAIQHGVKNVVVLSTDKAAYPINAMGISKAMMEKVAIAKARQLGDDAATTICCTRYGNVMASRGSVIPLWIDQIQAGKDITITDPNMTRFMMTLDDAVDLVLYAFENGRPGDIFVQKAPASTVGDLAQAMKELLDNGHRPDAVFATSDPKAMGIIRAIRDAGLRVPQDISVMGFDNLDFSSQIDPPLTTVAQPFYEMGVRACRRLIHLIEKGQNSRTKVEVLPAHLVIRKSVI